MHEQIKLLIQSGNPLISIETRDEDRALTLIREVATLLDMSLFEWSMTTGLVRTKPKPVDTGIGKGKASAALDHILEKINDKELYVFKDISPFCKEPLVHRQLRDMLTRSDIHVILIEGNPLPDSMRRLTIPLHLPLPTAVELEQVVRDTYRRIRESSYYEISTTLTKGDLEQLVQTLRGLTCSEAARVVAAAIHDDLALTPEDLPRIVEGKRSMLQAAGCLEAVNVNFTPDEIGGLVKLKRWLERRQEGMSNRAREFGLDPPRGILLLGVQGCGKSLCAKVVAAAWQMPLLRMDPGVLYQKFVGETENRLRDALAQAESMAPAILWIDEIEKAFASASAESADGGLSQRMFGTLLSWMQDHRSPIFMVATANNISALPPELMRKGRFDEVFFVDLPNAQAREQILSIHLKRRQRDPQKFKLDKISKATNGFSGAELEQMIIAALYAAFADNVELTDKHLLAEAATTRPLSILMAERMQELRSWAEHRCVAAE
jgi:ATP-dependent 26S proteasome regulatory subunit